MGRGAGILQCLIKISLLFYLLRVLSLFQNAGSQLCFMFFPIIYLSTYLDFHPSGHDYGSEGERVGADRGDQYAGYIRVDHGSPCRHRVCCAACRCGDDETCKSNRTDFKLCVCVCVCVCVCMRACVRACVHACVCKTASNENQGSL